MVTILRKGSGAVARFGQGTVKIKPYTLKTRFGGQVELTTCKKTATGADPGESVRNSNKIVLDFSTLESLDAVIKKLQDLREDMENDADGV